MTKLADRRPIIRLALSRAEVAVAIGVSVSSVDQMVAEGALPQPRKWHSRKLWLVSEIEAYLNEWPTEGDADLSKWETGLVAESQNGMASEPSHALQKYYDKLGFDPLTMGFEDLKGLEDAADERWAASIPESPLNKRERDTLEQLSGYGVGVVVQWKKIKNCGCDTEERLKARGFITTRNQAKFPDRIDSFILTEAGLEAWQNLLNAKSS